MSCTCGFFVTLNLLAAVGAMKGVNMDDLGTDLNETIKMLDRVVYNWIEKNPDKAKVIAAGIADTVKEYENIQANW